MKFRIADNLYTEAINEKKVRRLLTKLKLKRPVANLFLVTMPLYDAGIMEIYDYNELLQPFYRKKKQVIPVLGLATSKEAARSLVADILSDVYSEKGEADITGYFGIGGAAS